MAVQKRADEQANLTSSDKTQNRGEMFTSHLAVAAAFNLTKYTHYRATGGGAGITGTLPAVSAANLGKTYCVKKIDVGAGAVTVARAGADLIDGAVNVVLAAQWAYVWLRSDGVSNWDVVG